MPLPDVFAISRGIDFEAGAETMDTLRSVAGLIRCPESKPRCVLGQEKADGAMTESATTVIEDERVAG
jgi:hypothetical protein